MHTNTNTDTDTNADKMLIGIYRLMSVSINDHKKMWFKKKKSAHQSKSTYAHPMIRIVILKCVLAFRVPFVDSGSVGPVLLQGIINVLLFIWYVGSHFGSKVGRVLQPLWLQPGG
jgi:hypothetical protein